MKREHTERVSAPPQGDDVRESAGIPPASTDDEPAPDHRSDPRVARILKAATPNLRRKLAAIHTAEPALGELILQSLPSGSQHLLTEVFEAVVEEASEDGPGRLALTPLGLEVTRAAAELTATPGEADVFGGARMEARSPAMREFATDVAARYGLSLSLPERTTSEVTGAGVDSSTRSTRSRRIEASLMSLGMHILPSRVIATTANLLGETGGIWAEPLPDGAGERDVVAAIAQLARRIGEEGDAAGDEALGLGVAVGGHVDSRRGLTVKMARYPFDLASPSLAKDIEDATGLATLIQNDANAVAIYEHAVGDAVDVDSAAVVIVGEGVGSGVIEHGRLVEGHRGLAGEIGHIVVEPDERECMCGNKGCLETVAGTQAIPEIIAELDGAHVGSFDDAVSRLKRADKPAELGFERAARVLGRGIAALLNMSNPAKLILYMPPALLFDSGTAGEVFVSSVWAEATDHAFSNAGTTCELVTKALEEDSVARAAAIAQLDNFSVRY